MSYRGGFWGGGYGSNNSGVSRQTSIIIGVVVVVVACLVMVLFCCFRRRRSAKRMRNRIPPTLPTHTMSQLPPPPAAYIRPTSTNDLPTYRPRQDAPPSAGPHAVWAAPAPPYQPRSPLSHPKESPVVSSPSSRRSIFRRPVPPLHTADDLAPPPSPIPRSQAPVLPQVTPYEHRRGENPFGQRGIDGRHPGAPESEAGDVALERSGPVAKPQEAPPGYAEVAGRA